MLIFTLKDFSKLIFRNNYVYPNWAYGLGWIIVSLSLIPIPVYAIWSIVSSKEEGFVKVKQNYFFNFWRKFFFLRNFYLHFPRIWKNRTKNGQYIFTIQMRLLRTDHLRLLKWLPWQTTQKKVMAPFINLNGNNFARIYY